MSDELEEKKRLITTLLEKSAFFESWKESIKREMDFQRAMRPNIDPKLFKEFVDNISAEKLIELFLPVYDKYFAIGELKELLRLKTTVPILIKSDHLSHVLYTEKMDILGRYCEELSNNIVKKYYPRSTKKQ